MKTLFLLLFAIVCNIGTYAQVNPIGGWRTYMGYQQTIGIENAGDFLYGISKSGVFTLDMRDSSMQAISKLDGLSEVAIKTATYDKTSATLIIGYENSNIDIIRNKEIVNVNDIFKKEIVGIKSINSIDCIDGIAYINCGFGVVLYDLQRREVKDTYYLGDDGAALAVYNVTKIGNRIYAATDSGILEADYLNPNLANYQNWTQHGVSQGYPHPSAALFCLEFNNELFAYIKDTLFTYNGTNWYLTPRIYQGGMKKARVDGDRLIIINDFSVVSYYSDFRDEVDIVNPSVGIYSATRSAVYDRSGYLWIADEYFGLKRYDKDENLTGVYYPNGPFGRGARRLAIKNSKLIVASGSVGDNYSNKFVHDGIYSYKQGQWKNQNFLTNPALDSFYDFTVVAFDPKTNKEYYGTFWKGMLEVENDQFIKNYSFHNSTLGEAFGNAGQYRVTGLAFDSKSQLWVSNYWAERPISVRRANGQWQSFSFPGVFSEYKYVADITIDKFDQKWVLIPRSNAILVFKENTNGTTTHRKLTSGTGNGNLPKDASEVLAVTEDLEGHIWVGTNKGMAIFYNPSSVLNSGTNSDAQPIKVVDGEFVQDLLGNEVITCIKVDGANRKWVGTNNGAWLFSDDGLEQIHYFNTQNSPLLSNRINDIAIDPATGEVYFGTDIGIVSYRSDATAGTEFNQEQVKVFPNPVRENYEGPIAIDGLVQNADVKITDINGRIVFHSKANGAQAIWYGKNFTGDRVQSGVYLVYSTDAEGIEKMVNKILFIH